MYDEHATIKPCPVLEHMHTQNSGRHVLAMLQCTAVRYVRAELLCTVSLPQSSGDPQESVCSFQVATPGAKKYDRCVYRRFRTHF